MQDSPVSPSWHLVQVSSRAHDTEAVGRLRRHYEVYYPQQRYWRAAPMRSLSKRQRETGVSRMQEHLQPMFPRYVFTRFLPEDNWRDVFRLVGVTGLVIRRGLPVPIADDLITRLKAHEINGAIPADTPAIAVFRFGQRVEITDGPFVRLRGHIERIVRTETLGGMAAPTRLIVLIELCGASRRVDVDAEAVTRL